MKTKWILTIAVAFGLSLISSAQDLIKNAKFNSWQDGKPANWVLANNKQKVFEGKADGLKGANKVLAVEVITDGGSSLGEIRQNIKITPNTSYKFSGWLKSSAGGVAIFMIKLRKGRSELKRISVGKSTTEWQQVEKVIDTESADNLQVLCRYKQKANMIGSKCYFGKLELKKQ